MSFGEQLRQARERRGWSRFRLLKKVRETLKDSTLLSEHTIELLERGKTRAPRATTRNILTQVLPELGQAVPN